MFVKNVLSYSGTNLYALLIRMVQEFVVRWLLPPEVLGLWSLILVLQSFGITFDLGVMPAVARKLPILYGENKISEAEQYRKSSFYLHLTAKFIIAVGIVIYAVIYHPEPEYIYAALFAGLFVFIASIGESFIYFYQSAQNFTDLSKRLLVYWTAYGFLMIGGTYFAKLKGLIIATAVLYLLQAFLLRKSFHGEVRGEKSTRPFEASKSLLKFAIPFRLVDYPMNLAEVLDSIFVAKLFGLKALAVYMTGKVIFSQVGQIPTWVGRVFIVRLNTMYGSQKKSRKELGEEVLMNFYLMYFILLPVLIAMALILSHVATMYFLIKYTGIMQFLAVLLMSLYFMPRVTLIRNFWVLEKNFTKLAISNLIGISVMMLGFSFLYIYNHVTLYCVSWVFYCSFCAYFLFVIFDLGLQLWGSVKLIKFLFYLVICQVWLLYIYQYLDVFSLYQNNGSLKNTLFTTLYVSSLNIPILLFGFSKINILSLMKKRRSFGVV